MLAVVGYVREPEHRRQQHRQGLRITKRSVQARTLILLRNKRYS